MIDKIYVSGAVIQTDIPVVSTLLFAPVQGKMRVWTESSTPTLVKRLSCAYPYNPSGGYFLFTSGSKQIFLYCYTTTGVCFDILFKDRLSLFYSGSIGDAVFYID